MFFRRIRAAAHCSRGGCTGRVRAMPAKRAPGQQGDVGDNASPKRTTSPAHARAPAAARPKNQPPEPRTGRGVGSGQCRSAPPRRRPAEQRTAPLPPGRSPATAPQSPPLPPPAPAAAAAAAVGPPPAATAAQHATPRRPDLPPPAPCTDALAAGTRFDTPPRPRASALAAAAVPPAAVAAAVPPPPPPRTQSPAAPEPPGVAAAKALVKELAHSGERDGAALPGLCTSCAKVQTPPPSAAAQYDGSGSPRWGAAAQQQGPPRSAAPSEDSAPPPLDDDSGSDGNTGNDIAAAGAVLLATAAVAADFAAARAQVRLGAERAKEAAWTAVLGGIGPALIIHFAGGEAAQRALFECDQEVARVRLHGAYRVAQAQAAAAAPPPLPAPPAPAAAPPQDAVLVDPPKYRKLS
eukprot:TRINITY_DN14832_c0_g1_i6.p1 TRINITY_DN14832_c0_g1~~TRINITY_DN14832_c0_g1_i6.p1  ORF type:complete len:408 (+),score=48.45 TRINITY_DN14832_c0_g1_i6:29-1252(+)